MSVRSASAVPASDIRHCRVLVVLVPRGMRLLDGDVLLMVEALENDELVHEAPAIVGRETPSALAHAAT
jgi:hypothetical protein